MKENELLKEENDKLREDQENLKIENLALIQKNHETLDSDIYRFKINDLEKQNQYLLGKLQEKNKEVMEITEKMYNVSKKTCFIPKEIKGENQTLIPGNEPKTVKILLN